MRSPSQAFIQRRLSKRIQVSLAAAVGGVRTCAAAPHSQDTVLPTSSSSFGVQANATLSRQIVLGTLLGETISPRGTTPWSASTCTYLHASVVRTDTHHVLHLVNHCVQAVLLDALHRRQPFSSDEVHEVRRRLSVPPAEVDAALPVHRTLDAKASTTHNVHASTGTTSSSSGATLLGRLRDAPVAEWLSLGRWYLADAWRRVQTADGHEQRTMLQHAWDDLLFPWSQHDALAGQRDPTHLSAALRAITALVQWQVDCILDASSERSIAWALVSPRWLRKLRKSLCNHGRLGNISAFAEGLCALIQQEERLPAGSDLVHDAELLQFLVTIPCRKDAGIARGDIATRTTTYAVFALPRLWHLSCMHNRGDPSDAAAKCIQSAANAVAFSKNDNGEVERLTAFANAVLSTLADCHTSHAAGGSDALSRRPAIPATSVQLVCTALCDAALLKCTALHFTTAGAWMALACVRAVVGSWLQRTTTTLQSSLVPLDELLFVLQSAGSNLHVAADRHVARSVLKDAQQVLVDMAAVVRAPDVYDRIGQQVCEVADVVLRPYRFACGAYHPLVVAVGAVAPQASLWCKEDASTATWQCGCGASVMRALSACPTCSLRDDVTVLEAQRTSSPLRYECPSCHASCHGDGIARLRGCGSCGAEHPRIVASVAARSWNCDVCDHSVQIADTACGTCSTANPLHAMLCTTCGHRNHIDQQCCKRCGDPLSMPTTSGPQSTPAPVIPLLWLCEGCDALSEVPRENAEDGSYTPMCLACAARGQHHTLKPGISLQTHHFQWQCGCGAWNGPSSRRCHACCPQQHLPTHCYNASGAPHPVPVPVPVPAVYYQCPTCQCACGASDVTATPLRNAHYVGWRASSMFASCATCNAIHPRDHALLHARRLATCPSCEEPLPMVRPAALPSSCPHCSAPIDGWSAQATAVSDTPWPCHACGTTNHPTRGGEAAAVCVNCATERPSALLFQLNERWSCAACGNTSCRGFCCTTCSIPNPHLPLAEVPLWACSSCSALNHSWDAQCWHCNFTRSTRDALFPNEPWQCRRCTAKNGAANDTCYRCSARPHPAVLSRMPGAVNGQHLGDVRALLLQAAGESCVKAQDEASMRVDLSLLHDGDGGIGASVPRDMHLDDVMRGLSFP